MSRLAPPEGSRSLGANAVTLGAGVLAWWGVAELRFAGRPLIATPWDTLMALPRSIGVLGADLFATTARAAVGLALGVVAGLVAGGLAALALRRAPVVEGMLDFARSIPPVVVLPLFLLALGYGESARVATIAAGCVWTMALSVTTAAAAPRSARGEMLHLAGATRLQALAWTQPWESLGVLVVGLRTSASTAVIVAVVTEMIAGVEWGIGSRVISAQIVSDTTALTLNVLAVGAVGFVANVGLRRLERWARRFEAA